jgi:protein PhnA
MTLNDFLGQIKSQGLHPICVESLSELSYDKLTFSGTLEEYLEAVKSLRSGVIFVSTIRITEEYFLYLDDEEDEDDENADIIELCSVVPDLSKFKKRIGEDGHFDLSVPIVNGILSFSMHEEWMERLFELLNKARDLVNENRASELALIHAEEIEKSKEMIKKLHALISDKDFVRLPTQRAMQEYAIDKIPELEDLAEHELKREIQSLKAKIQARSLGKKIMDVKDSNGNVLKDGDSVQVIKDLKVKGASVTLKRGTVIKNIRLGEGDEAVEGNSDKVKGLRLKPEFLKKV